jgi:hypothetical protein
MAVIYVEQDTVNATEGYTCGKTDPEETEFETKGEVFKWCLKRFGKCVSRVYIDRESGRPRKIGWVFQKRVKYDDCNQMFLQETWITLHKAPSEHKTVYHYL